MPKINKIFMIILTTIACSVRAKDANETVGFLFAHSIGQNKRQIEHYKKNNGSNWHILPEDSKSFNFPEVVSSDIYNPIFDPSKTNFAQLDDINALKEAYDEYNVDKVVLVGSQRGAATAINFAANEPERLAALILESPFDSIENAFYDYWGWLSFYKNYKNKINHPAYNGSAIKPINIVDNINQDIPILFVHSKVDSEFPVQCSQRLYAKLKNKNHKHIYFLELKTGKHMEYHLSKDASRYQYVVHAFLAKYNLPHNKELAKKGKDLLSECRPRCFHEKD